MISRLFILAFLSALSAVSCEKSERNESEAKQSALMEAGWALARVGMVATAGAAIAVTMLDGLEEGRRKVKD